MDVRELVVAALILVAVHGIKERPVRGPLPIPDDKLQVVSANVGKENEDFDDPTKKWYSGVTAYEMITVIRIVYHEVDGIKNIRCVGFTYGDQENNCPAESSVNTVKDFVLERDEFVTSVSADNFISILSIYFETNKGLKIGPFGSESDPTKYNFHFSNGGAPLLYVEGLQGMWLYSLYFTFHYTGVMSLENVTNEFASKSYAALSTHVDDLFEINDDYRRMHPDIARKGCYAWDAEQTPEAEIACDFQTLLDQVNMLTLAENSLQQHSARNLLTLKDLDSSKYMDEVSEAKSFHELLTALEFGIAMVIEVTLEQSKKLSNYFSTSAEFDKEIAEQDLAFIKGQIQAKQEGSDVASRDVGDRLHRVLSVGITLAVGAAIEAIAEFTTLLASYLNPFVWLFGGPDFGELFDAFRDLMAAVRDLVELSTLMANLQDWLDSAQAISDKFQENQAAIEAMEDLVNMLSNETDVDKIEQYANNYIKSYGDYTPQVTSQDIIYTTTLLGAVGDEACSVLSGMEGKLTSAIASDFKAATLDCVYLPASVAVLDSYFEDVYTLQFEMIDSLTSIVKGSIAVAMSERIGDLGTTIDIRTVAIGSAMVETHYQGVSLARCDILEYRQAGVRPDVCKRLLFKQKNIQELIAYTGSYAVSERNVFGYIPTTAQEDKAIPFVNISSLLQGEYQRLTLPVANKEWMKMYGWLPSEYEIESAFYVRGLEIYIPGLMCNESGQAVQTVRVDALSANPTYLYSEEAPPRYTVDKEAVTFEFTQPADFCADDKISFPVKDNETRQVQTEVEICYISHGLIDPDPKPDFTYPSLGTTFTFKVSGSYDCTLVEDPTAFDFQPLITVRLTAQEIKAKKEPSDPGIDECWPDDTRCPADERCQDRELDYCCQDSQGVCD